MIELFSEVAQNYLTEKNNAFKENSLGTLVRKDIPNEIMTFLDPEKFSVKGSIGQGQWAVIPWVCIYNKAISAKTTYGIDIAILFKADMTGFYITLNQGWTFFKNSYKPKQIAKEKIKQASYTLSNIVDDLGYSVDPIDLGSSETLAVGYELGSIFNKYYDIECLPTNEEFEEDIKAFTQMLVEVELYIGKNRSFEDFYREILNNSFYQALIHDQSIFKEVDDNDETYVYQIEEEMAESPAEEIIEEPTQRKDPVINRGGQENWPRDSKIAAIALKKTNFLCEVDPTHQTFTSRKTGKSYMEAHHLIPMGRQGEFDYSLDKIANIKCICPNCHRLLHHGTDSERNQVLEILYQQSISNLRRVNLSIAFDELKTFY